jgi:hypothetical protein
MWMDGKSEIFDTAFLPVLLSGTGTRQALTEKDQPIPT